MTHISLAGTRCRIIRTTGPLKKQMVEAITESGIQFTTTQQQFTKDWKPI